MDSLIKVAGGIRGKIYLQCNYNYLLNRLRCSNVPDSIAIC
jgi:hypothetical protein